MNRILFGCLFLLFFATAMQGQKSEGGKPYSGTFTSLKSTAPIPGIHLKELDIQHLMGHESEQPAPVRYGIVTDTLIDLKVAGKMDIVPSAGKIWRLRISNNNALSIQLFFKRFVLPSGAVLHLYNDNRQIQAGAFTQRNFQPDSTFTIADFKGNHVIIEYFEPLNPEFEGRVIIGSIGQAYKDVLESESGPGFININCPVGKDAQLAKHAVCRMAFRSGSFQVTCSGALINNAKNDGIPYFLTANHCLSSQNEAQTLNVYFNYEVEGCAGDTLETSTLSGSTLISTGQQSDYTLLRLTEMPTGAHQAYYAGWNINDQATKEVTGIHVPFGNTMKISIDYDSIVSNQLSVTWDDDSRSPVGSHWIIGYDDGGTSQGSSGSPLFNLGNQIIGQLHGGDEIFAYYGKLSYSYANKPANYHSIGHYLDPDSTGVTEIDGYYPADNIPDAFFTSPFEQVCHNTPITFKDYSVFGPYERTWSVHPSGFDFLDGTDQTSPNPVIEFHQDTIYTVRLDLKVDGEIESSEALKIISGDDLDIQFKSNIGTEICDCDFELAKLEASGADSFSWSVLPVDIDKIAFSNPSGDTTTMTRISGFKAISDYTVGFRIIGKQSTCIDTLLGTLNLIKPENDEIENAILLDYGMSSMYSNICASVEEGEPIPPFISCTTQNSWCDEYGTGEDIVENSVWFKFVASPTGYVSISSTGFDNEIALYEADSHQEILAGNYVIVGANDDRSETNFRPLLISEPVIPGNIYWIQVDGSGGGTEDDFYITINELSPTPNETYLTGNIAVYPIPADHHVTLYNSEWSGYSAGVHVYNISGICIFDDQIDLNDNGIVLNVSSWESGIYVAMIETAGARYLARIVKR